MTVVERKYYIWLREGDGGERAPGEVVVWVSPVEQGLCE